MSNRVNKWLVAGMFISLIMMIVGYFLWAIDVPADRLAELTAEEVNQIQQELALNYSAGAVLLNLGFVSFTELSSVKARGFNRGMRAYIEINV